MDNNDTRDLRLSIIIGVLAIISCCTVTIFPADQRLIIVAPLMVAMLVGLIMLLRGDGTPPY